MDQESLHKGCWVIIEWGSPVSRSDASGGQEDGFGAVLLSTCLECFSETFPQSRVSRSVPPGEAGRGWREAFRKDARALSEQSLS